ncbi:MAG: host attachment protein [Candidatus Liptonbacteria bacterium]|nr:host attachment protein [Candidatus Liptonbacteria bacterium]
MKIKPSLSGFGKRPAILLVSGAQDAILYAIADGNIAKRGRVTVKALKYSDREGFFGTRRNPRSGKGVARAGFAREKDKWKPREEFFKEIAAALMDLRSAERTEALFIFAPAYIAKELEAHLPAGMRRMIAKTFRGEYTHAHPFELLEKIARAMPAPVSVLPAEAGKILKRKKRP